MIVDISDSILGRAATKIAKAALLGETITVVNCEKAVVSGNKKQVLAKYKQRLARGQPTTGPFYQKSPDRFVRRVIRGMLPHKQEKGRLAYKRVKCYINVPEEFKNQKLVRIAEADIEKLPSTRYVTVEEICKAMGGKR